MGAISLYQKDKLQESINFPPTKAGKKSRVVYELRNNLGTKVEIEEVILKDNEVIIESVTKNLDPLGNGELILSWNPDKDRLFPLNTTIHFKELIG